MNTQEILATLKKAGKPQTAAIYKHYGAGDNVFGTLTSEIGKLHKKIKVDHALAKELWKTGNIVAGSYPYFRFFVLLGVNVIGFVHCSAPALFV